MTHLPRGADVTPEVAGWRYLSFRVATLDMGEELSLDPAFETAIITIEGGTALVERTDRDDEALTVYGRPSVFESLPHAAYIPAGVPVRIIGVADSWATETVIAIAQAPPSGRDGAATQPVMIWPTDIRVEVRGAGNATRQINHIITPEFPADRLEVVEVYTPSGNWSSWPPHKHDTDDMPREAVLEEIYHYRFRRPEAWGVQRLYGGSVEGLWAVRDGETVIVADGYHPFVSTHGDDAYYLNALAGDIRTMACSFDPALDHVRQSWPGMPADPRVPLVR